MKAAEVMVSKVITVGVDATIGEVATVLLSNHISGLPVVGEKGELVGIVSEGDRPIERQIYRTRFSRIYRRCRREQFGSAASRC